MERKGYIMVSSTQDNEVLYRANIWSIIVRLILGGDFRIANLDTIRIFIDGHEIYRPPEIADEVP